MMKLTLLGCVVSSFCPAQDQGDPFAGDESDPKVPIEDVMRFRRNANVELVIEVFSLPRLKAAEWRRETDKDTEFYGKLVGGLRSGEVTLDDFFSGATKGGEMVIFDGAEYIYPTEYELAAGVRNPETLKQWEEAFAPASPSAFDTTFLGTWFEVKAGCSAWCDLIDLELSLSKKRLLEPEIWGRGGSAHKMPTFGLSQIQAHLPVRSGLPTMLGTMNELGLGEKSDEVRVVFVRASAQQEKVIKVPPENFGRTGFCYEVFSLSLNEAAELARMKGGTGGSYRKLVEGSKLRQIKMEKFTMIQGWMYQAMKNEEIVEYIYPTEYNPPGFGDELVMPERKRDRREFPFLSWAFDTENLGDTLQLEGLVEVNGEVSFRLFASHQALLGRHAFAKGLAMIEQPEFASQTIKSSGTLSPRKARFVGTVTPVTEKDRVWLAFLTDTGGE